MDYQNKTRFIRLFQQTLMWPYSDSVALKYYQKIENFNFPEEISALLDQKRTVIQAGGHVGLYAMKYSAFFDNVLTFEPEEINYGCLVHNTKNLSNVRHYKKCLGEEKKLVELDINPINTGNHSISQTISGKIECVPIDSLNLENLDLIHLDVEGYELFVLQGAKESLEKYKPAIVIENNRLSKKYNYKLKSIESFLTSCGYAISKKWKNDLMFRFSETQLQGSIL